MTETPPDNLILAFSPSSADHALDGHHWALYCPDFENPYDVPNGDKLLQQATETIDPHEWPQREWEYWTRLDWHTVVGESDIERVETEKPSWYLSSE